MSNGVMDGVINIDDKERLDTFIKERTDNFMKSIDERIEKHANGLIAEIKKIKSLYNNELDFYNLTEYLESIGLKDKWESYLKDVIISGVKSEMKKRKEEINCQYWTRFCGVLQWCIKSLTIPCDCQDNYDGWSNKQDDTKDAPRFTA